MEKEYKRKTREMSQETKDAISKALKGRVRTDIERIKISLGLKKYWSEIPPSPIEKVF